MRIISISFMAMGAGLFGYLFLMSLPTIAKTFDDSAPSYISLVNNPITKTNDTELPSWALGPFMRPNVGNPILSPDSTSIFYDPMRQERVAWEANDVFNPAAVLHNNKIVVLYRAEDKSGVGIGGRTSRIGFATSKNGVTMKRRKAPVLFPTTDNQKEFEWDGGCEDPRVAQTEDGKFVMLYTQWNKKVPRLAVAHSTNLKSWTKYGPVFRLAHAGKFFNDASKSASIVTKIVNGKLQIAKINGKYFMYWGEAHVYGATSTDLINWEPLLDEKGALKQLMSPRAGFFDSQLTECGPPALLTDKGILLLYNGKNLPATNANRSTKYTADSYCAGQALFDAKDPTKFIARLNDPYLKPEASFEKSGQYPAGTVFTEGLVFFKNKWFLYYGCADSRVAVAIYEPKR